LYSGRFLIQPNNVSFVWSGSTISTTFTGTSIGVVMRDPHGQYDIFIDGRKSFVPFNPKSALPSNFPLAAQLEDETHTFMMRRRTEGFSNAFGDGTASVFGFYVDQGKTLLPPTKPSALPQRKIEVLGDSITCGAGVLGENGACNFTFDTQDYFSTYTALLAQHFNAQVNVICWSGKGLVRNYNASQHACYTCPDAMPAYFPYTLDILNDSSTQWNFSSYQPDVLIINLGVNDFDPQNPTPALAEDQFKLNYENLIEDIYTKYYNGNVHVLLACRVGNTLSGPCNLIAEIAESAATRNPRVQFVNLTTNEPDSTLGCEGHPGMVGHRMMADLLIAKVGPTTGWTVDAGLSHLEASSAIILAAFFLVGLGGHIWGCVVRKPTKEKGNLLLEQKQDR
jgi:lysophospholipase L1-like esterase